jgi:hypothetical protein
LSSKPPSPKQYTLKGERMLFPAVLVCLSLIFVGCVLVRI